MHTIYRICHFKSLSQNNENTFDMCVMGLQSSRKYINNSNCVDAMKMGVFSMHGAAIHIFQNYYKLQIKSMRYM